MTEDACVLTDVRGAALVVTINRPAARNAVNNEVARGIADAMDELDARDDLAVGLLTGAGGTFCAGMDLKAFARGEDAAVPGRGFAGITRRPPNKPLIAAVEGWALGGGFELALSADIVVAARDARFGLPEVKRGMLAAAGGLLRLPKAIGYTRAMELALTGEPIDAERAQAWGLVNRTVSSGLALQAALELADMIAANGPLAVRASKAILSAAVDWTDEQAFTSQLDVATPVFASHDALEGARAFAGKRAPVWTGA